MRIYMKNYVLELGGLINAKVESANDSTRPKDKEGAESEKPNASTSGNLYTALRWVQDILELQEKFNKIIDFAVLKDKSFQTAVNEVEFAVNYRIHPQFETHRYIITSLSHYYNRHSKRLLMTTPGLQNTFRFSLMRIWRKGWKA